MVQLSDNDYEEFKEISDKEGITYESDFEMKQSAINLVRFVELLIEMDQEHRRWDQRLEKEPKGFAMHSEGRRCGLCGQCVFGDIWYDKWGLSCMNCHAAYVKRIIPGYVIKDHDHEKSITVSTLSWKFGLHPQTIMKLVRHGKIKARQVPDGPTVLLRRENPDLAKIIADEKSKMEAKTHKEVS